jgi:hypothetical protein
MDHPFLTCISTHVQQLYGATVLSLKNASKSSLSLDASGTSVDCSDKNGLLGGGAADDDDA